MCVKVPPEVTMHYMTDLYAADVRGTLPSLKAPTLVLASASSTNPAVIKMARTTWMELLKDTPTLTFALFENTKHFIQDDRPAELDAAIADFLAGREVKGYAMPATSQTATSKPASRPATRPSP